VSLVDIPEAHTFTDDEDQITARATDCALTALEGHMKVEFPVPALQTSMNSGADLPSDLPGARRTKQ
jgi:hypothetical protein